MKYRPFRRTLQLVSLVLLNVLLFNYTPLKLSFSNLYLPLPVLIGISSEVSVTPGLLDVLQVAISRAVIPLSAVALMLIIGATVGRALCGWVCPIGFIQDLTSTLSGETTQISKATDRTGKKVKYVLLTLTMGITGAIGLGRAFGSGEAYIVAMGTLADGTFIPFSPDNILFGEVPHIIIQGGAPLERSYISLFILQGILLLILFWGATSVTRFWCRYICPLGGLMALFAKVSLVGLRRNLIKCIKCPNCEGACIMGVKILGRPWRKLNDYDCIMCMECVDACPHKALKPAL